MVFPRQFFLRITLHFGLIGLLGYLLIGLFLAPAGAQTMSNKDYILKTQGLNSVSGVTSNEDYRLNTTAGELETADSEGVNFKVRTGFENTREALPFSVSLSSDVIDFGALSPTNPIVRTVDLSIYSLSTFGYSVIASQDHPLQMPGTTEEIPNTTCDNGECSQEKAGAWTNTLTYGFGYRCDNIIGADCDISFSNTKFYKQFADISNGQSPQTIMSGNGSESKSSTESVQDKEIRLSYKVNISGNQAQGVYNNIITFIAVPNF